MLTLLLVWPASGSEAQTTPRWDLTEGNIGKLLARVLEQVHFSHQPFNDQIAKRLLEIYLDDLDAQHLNFLQSDIDEFQPYATTLDELTKGGNIGPAQTIYSRFLHRIEQRVG